MPRSEINKKYYLKNREKVLETKKRKRLETQTSKSLEKLIIGFGDKTELMMLISMKMKHEKNMENEEYSNEQGLWRGIASMNCDYSNMKFGDVERVYLTSGIWIIVTGIGSKGEVMFGTEDDGRD